jgi:hypothetical protein
LINITIEHNHFYCVTLCCYHWATCFGPKGPSPGFIWKYNKSKNVNVACFFFYCEDSRSLQLLIVFKTSVRDSWNFVSCVVWYYNPVALTRYFLSREISHCRKSRNKNKVRSETHPNLHLYGGRSKRVTVNTPIQKIRVIQTAFAYSPTAL